MVLSKLDFYNIILVLKTVSNYHNEVECHSGSFQRTFSTDSMYTITELLNCLFFSIHSFIRSYLFRLNLWAIAASDFSPLCVVEMYETSDGR